MELYLGGCKPGERSQSLMCVPVSACRALLFPRRSFLVDTSVGGPAADA
jgi:hypothetical protein